MIIWLPSLFIFLLTLSSLVEFTLSCTVSYNNLLEMSTLTIIVVRGKCLILIDLRFLKHLLTIQEPMLAITPENMQGCYHGEGWFFAYKFCPFFPASSDIRQIFMYSPIMPTVAPYRDRHKPEKTHKLGRLVVSFRDFILPKQNEVSILPRPPWCFILLLQKKKAGLLLLRIAAASKQGRFGVVVS